jgi:hypothetical protein
MFMTSEALHRRLMSWAVVVALLPVTACSQQPEPKPLAERILDRMVQRCKAIAPKDEQVQCVLPPGLSTLEATNAMHRILVKQGMTMFPRDGHCDRHGLFMICTEKIGEKATSVMYRLDDAKDGSDSKGALGLVARVVAGPSSRDVALEGAPSARR